MSRLVGRLVVYALAALSICAVLAALVLVTPPGQRGLVRVATWWTSSKSQSIQVEGFHGSLFSAGGFARITIADANGPWLRIEDVRFAWQPSDLFRGLVSISEITAGRILVDRKPLPASSPARASGHTRGGTWRLPLGIKIDKAQLQELSLAPSVLGRALRVEAHANLAVKGPDSDAAAHVVVRRTDGRQGTLSAKLGYQAATGNLEANVVADEPAGGIVAGLLESPGLPPLRATLTARGSLADMHANLVLKSGSTVFTVGDGRWWREQQQQRFTARLDGYLTTVLPSRWRDVFAGRTRATFAGRLSDEDKIHLDEFTARSDALNVDASGLLDLARSFLQGKASLRLARKDGRAITLPFGGQKPSSIDALVIKVHVADAVKQRPITVTAEATGLRSELGAVDKLTLTGSAIQPTPSGKNWQHFKAVSLSQVASGLSVADPRMRDLVSPEVTTSVRAHSDGAGLAIDELRVAAGKVQVSGHAVIARDTIQGALTGSLVDLSAFSALLDRPVAGAAKWQAKGTWQRVTGTANVDWGATFDNPKVGIAQLDALLAGSNTVHGKLRTDPDGALTLEKVAIVGPFGKGDLNFHQSKARRTGDFKLHVNRLGKATPLLDGGIVAAGHLKGKAGTTIIDLDIGGNKLQWRGRPVVRPSIRLRIDANAPAQNDATSSLAGEATISATYDGQRTRGALRFASQPTKGVKLDQFSLVYGGNKVHGWLTVGGAKGLDAELALDAPALQNFSSLLGIVVKGKVTARLAGIDAGKRDALRLTANAEHLAVDKTSLGRVALDARVSDTSVDPVGDAKLSIAGGSIGGRALSKLTLKMHGKLRSAGTFDLAARSGSDRLSLQGKIEGRDGAAVVTLLGGEVNAARVSTSIRGPAQIVLHADKASVEKLTLAVGGGHVTIGGRADSAALALKVAIARVPAGLVDIALPEFGASGEWNGSIVVSGTPANPTASYDLAWTGASSKASRRTGFPPISISANGKFAGGVLRIHGRAKGPDQFALSAQGTVAVKRAVALDLRATGQVPLTALNVLLAGRGTRGAGMLKGDVAISGNADKPNLKGTVSLAGGEIRDPESGVHLTDVRLLGRLSSEAFIVERFGASAVPGGRVSAAGRVGLDPATEFPVKLDVIVDRLKINDRKMIVGTLDARIGVSGALQRALRVGGSVALDRFDIAIPERIPRSVRELNIEHVNVSKEERAKLGLAAERPKDQAHTTPVALDLKITSNGKIFVRGRGMDAQFGGGLKLLGTAAAPVAEGQFHLVRGRMAIAGRRLNFNRGTIGFAGSLDPSLDFEAISDADGTTITTTVTGRASRPVIALTSSPQLPEDELLARLLFNKSLAKLSAIQIAQLASEVDRIGGLTSGPGVIDQLRKSVGVDTLDVTSDKKGNSAITAGKYVTGNAFVGVQQNTGSSTSRVTIDLDITKNIKARGETGSDGKSKLGVGVEFDY